MALAALKNFQELLFGRGQNVIDGKNKNRQADISIDFKCDSFSVQEEAALPLPDSLWLVSWTVS